MTREKMLARLHETLFYSEPTFATIDMGIQYDIATEEGIATVLGTLGSWPFYSIKPIASFQIARIQNAIKSHDLSNSDITGTDLEALVEEIKEVHSEIQDYSNLLIDFLSIPVCHEGPIYCLCDCYSWNIKISFFENKDQIEATFYNEYGCPIQTRWEELNDDVLESWIERIDRGVIYNSFDE